MAGPEQEPPVRPDEEWEEDPPRSLLSATWFRVVIVVLVVGAVAAVAVPMVMDSAQSPAPPVASTPSPPPSPPPVAAPTTPPAPAPPAPAAVAPASEPSKEAGPAAPPAPANADAPKTVASAQKTEPAKDAVTKTNRRVAAKTDAPKTSKAPKAKSPAAAARPDAGGELWVQVGAFRDAATAKKVATELKEKGYQVSESTLSRGGGTVVAPVPDSTAPAADKYDVLVTGAAPAEVTKKLTAKGLSADTVRDGAVVRPSLPLRDAVTLSNDLRAEGFTVTVRRVSTGAGATASAPAASSGTGEGRETLHRVRVGVFPDRAAATAAVEKLRELGYTPFIARGRE